MNAPNPAWSIQYENGQPYFISLKTSFTISAELSGTTSQEKCQALGMESRTIEDYQITASSEHGNFKPKEARLNNDNLYWSSANSNDPWIRVDLLTTTTVTGLIIQGSISNTERVETLKVMYKTTSDGNEHTIEENGSPKVSFTARQIASFANVWKYSKLSVNKVANCLSG